MALAMRWGLHAPANVVSSGEEACRLGHERLAPGLLSNFLPGKAG